jgi:ATP/maltotriose-dependent transcriptional regulator MalT
VHPVGWTQYGEQRQSAQKFIRRRENEIPYLRSWRDLRSPIRKLELFFIKILSPNFTNYHSARHQSLLSQIYQSMIKVHIVRGVMVQSQRVSIARRVGDLTDRERQIVALVCAGHPNKIIARKLQVGEGTIKTHLHAIYLKLGIENRASLINALGKTESDKRPIGSA